MGCGNIYVDALVNVDGFWRIRLRSGRFEGPVTVKPPALPWLLPTAETEAIARGNGINVSPN